MLTGQSSTGYKTHVSKEAEKYLFYSKSSVSLFCVQVANTVIFQEKDWVCLGALGYLVGEHGCRNVTFHQKVMIFDGGSKAEVLSKSAVWVIK